MKSHKSLTHQATVGDSQRLAVGCSVLFGIVILATAFGGGPTRPLESAGQVAFLQTPNTGMREELHQEQPRNRSDLDRCACALLLRDQRSSSILFVNSPVISEIHHGQGCSLVALPSLNNLPVKDSESFVSLFAESGSLIPCVRLEVFNGLAGDSDGVVAWLKIEFVPFVFVAGGDELVAFGEFVALVLGNGHCFNWVTGGLFPLGEYKIRNNCIYVNPKCEIIAYLFFTGENAHFTPNA